MTRYSGLLVQADAAQAKLLPETLVRGAVADYRARFGRPPMLVLVRKSGYEWPDEIDGVTVQPSPTIAYPTWMLLVNSTVEELSRDDVKAG